MSHSNTSNFEHDAKVFS